MKPMEVLIPAITQLVYTIKIFCVVWRHL